MKTINLKYQLKDTVVFKLDSGGTVATGTIENFMIVSTPGGPEISYFIKNENTKKVVSVNESNILNIANNVTNREVMTGYIAEAYAGEVLKGLDMSIKVLKIEFNGSKTSISYRVGFSDFVRKEFSECHPDDKFSKEKGVLACLCKISIKLLQRTLMEI